MCDYCALSVKRDFQDTELLVSIFPFLVDACKDLVSCKCISLQMRCWELEASAAPPGCLEIPILCLCLGVGVQGGWRRLEAQQGPCTQRWALPPARSPGATAERGAVVVLRRSRCCSHTPYLVRRSFFRSVRCLCSKAGGTSVDHQSFRAGGDLYMYFFIYMRMHTQAYTSTFADR